MNVQIHTDGEPAYHPRSRIWKIIGSVLVITFLLALMGTFFAAGAAAGYVASLVRDEPLRSYKEINDKIFANDQTGFAYFRDKSLIGKLRAEEDRILVKKEDVSPYLLQAIIAAEDKNFYAHRGIDIYGLSRAVLETVTGSPVQTGGSTLTQQLIKQTILGTEVTHERKAKEIFLALRMERMFSKEQILNAYMNKMYFGKSAGGSNIYGVQAAAKGIFGVDAKDLNIPQAAYIAGMLQAPSRYIPFHAEGLAAGKARQRIVLNRMLENGYITEKEYQESLNYDIQANLAKEERIKAYSKYPYLMMEIEERAARVLVDQEIKNNPKLNIDQISRQQYRERVDEKREQVLRGGYHIYTTIDQKIYEAMTAIAENPKNFGRTRSYTVKYGRETVRVKNALEEVGATLIDNKTGAILGFIAGRDFNVSQVNHTNRPRQPGSAMKPLAAYAPAFEKGLLQPGSWIEDAPLALENGAGNPPFYPSNYDNRFHGYITVREALAKSYNIPAIKAYLQVGIPESLGYVEKMGITTIVTPADNPNHNDYQAKTGVIGGLTQGVTVEEITGAYATFANLGVFYDPYLIERIEDAEGNVIYEHAIEPRKVFSEQTAYLMTDMMKTVVKSGTAAALRRYVGAAPEIAGKTGTTNNNVDSWFVGYTPELTLGVWIGYDIPYSLPDYKPAKSLTIWGKIMKELLALYPERYPKDSTFKRPPGIVSAYGELYDHRYVPATKPVRPGTEKEKTDEDENVEKPSDQPQDASLPADAQPPEKEPGNEQKPAPADPVKQNEKQPNKGDSGNQDKKQPDNAEMKPDKPAKVKSPGEETKPADVQVELLPPKQNP